MKKTCTGHFSCTNESYSITAPQTEGVDIKLVITSENKGLY